MIEQLDAALRCLERDRARLMARLCERDRGGQAPARRCRLALPRTDGCGELAASCVDAVAAALERAQLFDDAVESREAMLHVVAAVRGGRGLVDGGYSSMGALGAGSVAWQLRMNPAR